MRLIYNCLFLISVCIILLGIAVYYFKPAQYLELILSEKSSDIVSVEGKEVSNTFIFASDIESDFESLKYLMNLEALKTSDAVFITGDITHLGVKSDMELISETLSNYDKEVYLVPGDRDLWKSGIENFNDVFGDSYRFVEINNVSFLLIDNADEYDGISEDQWSFIEDNIESADFIVLHNPIYFEGSPLSTLFHKGMGQYSAEVETQRERLLALIRRSKVKAVFAGDQHIFSHESDSSGKELNYYIIGSLNKDRSLSVPTYAILTIYDDGQYTVESQILTAQQ